MNEKWYLLILNINTTDFEREMLINGICHILKSHGKMSNHMVNYENSCFMIIKHYLSTKAWHEYWKVYLCNVIVGVLLMYFINDLLVNSSFHLHHINPLTCRPLQLHLISMYLHEVNK